MTAPVCLVVWFSLANVVVMNRIQGLKTFWADKEKAKVGKRGGMSLVRILEMTGFEDKELKSQGTGSLGSVLMRC
jgi:hypothetical protein